jgi:hypothetical protein
MRVWENSIGNGAKLIAKARNREFFFFFFFNSLFDSERNKKVDGKVETEDHFFSRECKCGGEEIAKSCIIYMLEVSSTILRVIICMRYS